VVVLLVAILGCIVIRPSSSAIVVVKARTRGVLYGLGAGLDVSAHVSVVVCCGIDEVSFDSVGICPRNDLCDFDLFIPKGMLLGLAGGVAGVSLLGVLSVNLVVQAFGLYTCLIVEYLNVLLDITGASVFIITALEGIVS